MGQSSTKQPSEAHNKASNTHKSNTTTNTDDSSSNNTNKKEQAKKTCNNCRRPIVVGIGGATRSGKSTLSKALAAHFNSPLPSLSQDKFFGHDIPRDPYFEMANWETPEALDFDSMFKQFDQFIHEATIQCSECSGRDVQNIKPNYVFVEGFLLYSDPRIFDYLDKCIFIGVDYETSLQRRMSTTRVPPTYFQKLIWPNYSKYLASCMTPDIVSKHKILILDGQSPKEDLFSKGLQHIESNSSDEFTNPLLPLLSIPRPTVALTGCSSFLGSHILFILLNFGFTVHAIFRSASDAARKDIAEWNSSTHKHYTNNLFTYSLDLLKPNSCDSIFKECHYVIHTASSGSCEDDETIMKNILDSCNLSGVRKLIFTSSIVHHPTIYNFGEQFPATETYPEGCQARICAEIYANKFVQGSMGSGFELVSVLAPGVILGPRSPAAHPSQKYKHEDIQQFIKLVNTGAVVSSLKLPLIDVRDLAYAHVALMLSSGKGRYPCVSEVYDFAKVEKRRVGGSASTETNAFLSSWSTLDVKTNHERLQSLPYGFAFLHSSCTMRSI